MQMDRCERMKQIGKLCFREHSFTKTITKQGYLISILILIGSSQSHKRKLIKTQVWYKMGLSAMKNKITSIRYIVAILPLFMPLLIFAQREATIKETKQTYKTYPFSDPDPVPAFGNMYPYFRYDGFSNLSE